MHQRALAAKRDFLLTKWSKQGNSNHSDRHRRAWSFWRRRKPRRQDILASSSALLASFVQQYWQHRRERSLELVPRRQLVKVTLSQIGAANWPRRNGRLLPHFPLDFARLCFTVARHGWQRNQLKNLPGELLERSKRFKRCSRRKEQSASAHQALLSRPRLLHSCQARRGRAHALEPNSCARRHGARRVY